VTPAYAAGWRTAIPGAGLEVMRDAGHYPHWEQPEEFLRRVVAFVG
jgi:pimeloyl-ACP methyl ester carboxylesterase